MSEKTTMNFDQWREDIVFSEQLRQVDLRFCSTWGIFSPRSVDEGTRLLLDYIKIDESANCIDLGCGYGPIGLTLATLAPGGTTHMIDKDFVAVEYAQKNADNNSIGNTSIYLSNGFSHVPDSARFDLVTSNLPAKVGKEMLYLYFDDALRRMTPGAAFYVVTVNGLRLFIKRAFTEVFGNYKKLKQGKNYTVAVAYAPDC